MKTSRLGNTDKHILYLCVHPVNFPMIQFSSSVLSLESWLSKTQDFDFIKIANSIILTKEQREDGIAGVLVSFREGMLTAIKNMLSVQDATFSTYENDGEEGMISVSSISSQDAVQRLNSQYDDQPNLEFEDSVDATDTFEDLQSALADPRLQHWLEITDTNYGSELSPRFAQIREQFDALMEDFYAVDD